MRRVTPVFNTYDPAYGPHHRGSCVPLCSTCEARLKEIQTMAATTVTPPAPTTAPAAAVARAQKAAAKAAAPANPKKVVNFGLWKEAQSQARQIVGYTTASPIYGKTEQKVFAELLELLADAIAGTSTYKDSLEKAHTIVIDLQKRKIADEIAAKNYKQAVRAKA